MAAMSRSTEGSIFYFYEQPGIKYDMDTLEFVDVTKSPNVVYNKANNNLTYQELIDNTGKVVYRVAFPNLNMNMKDGINQVTWKVDVRIENTAPTFKYTPDQLIYFEHNNENTNPDPNRVTNLRELGINTIQPQVTNGDSGAGSITNTGQVGFFVTTAANIDGGRWVSYDGTDSTVLSLNPEGVAKYKLSIQNNSGGDVDGYRAIIPIPKAGQNTGNSLVQTKDFGWDMVLNNPLSNTDTNYSYSFKYSTQYTDNFVETTKAIWKDWTDIPNKNDIKSVLVVTNDKIFTSEKNDLDNPGFDEIIFDVGFNKATAEAQAGQINTYSALIKRSLAGIDTIVGSEPISVQLKTGLVKGTVYDDLDRSNTMNGQEKGIQYVTVQAYEAGTTNLIETTTTNKDGVYEFKGLEKTQKVDIVVVNPVTDDSMRFTALNPTDNQDKIKISNLDPSSPAAITMTVGLMRPYTVKFDGQNGSAVKNVKKYPTEKIIAADIVSPTKKGYTFAKWNKKANGAAADDITIPITVTADATYYARYTANKYTVTYKANGGTGADKTQQHTYDQKINLLPTGKFTRSGYTFLGWAETADASAPKYTPGQEVQNLSDKNGVTLYAVWQGDVLSVEGTMNFVDKNNANVANKKYNKDFTVTLYDGTTKLGSAKTDADGKYSIKNIQITADKAYTLKVEKPAGSKVEFAAGNEKTVNLIIGVDSKNNNFNITDKVAPVISAITMSPNPNPTTVTYTVADNETEIATQGWKITDAANTVVKSGTNQSEVAPAIKQLIDGPVTGKYKLTVTATDIAKNQSTKEASFDILAKTGTKPTIAATTNTKEIEVDKNSTNPDVSQVIADFGITAKDALGTAITAPTSYTVAGLDDVDFTTIEEYELIVTAKDRMGQSTSNNVKVKYVVKDTRAPKLEVGKTKVIYNNTFVDPKTPTIDDLEKSGIFGDIKVEDNDKDSTEFPLQSTDIAAVDFTTAGKKTINVFVKDNSNNESNKVKIEVEVRLYDGIDEDLGWAIKANSFTTSLDKVQTPEDIVKAANAKIYNIKVEPATEVPSTDATVVSNKNALTVGSNDIEFTVKRSNGVLVPKLKLQVTGKVFASMGDKYAINADNIVAEYRDVTTPTGIRNQAGVIVYDITDVDNPVEVQNAVVKIQQDNKDITRLGLGQNQKVTFIFEKDGEKVEKTVDADIYSDIVGKYGLMAESFVTSVDKVTNTGGILTESKAQVFDVETKQPVPTIPLTTTPDKLGEGIDQTVVIKATTIPGLEETVKADVFAVYKDGVGITALDDFEISLATLKNNVGSEKDLLAAGSKVKAYRYTNGVRSDVALTGIEITPIPTSTGQKDITYKVAGTSVQTTGKKVTVLDSAIELDALDSVVLTPNVSKTITETALLAKLETNASIDGTTLTPKFKAGDLNKLHAIEKGQEAPVSMTIEVKAPNGDAKTKVVKVFVVDSFDEDSMIGINAHDFKAQVSEINRDSFITKSGVKAYDFGNIVNGKPTPVVNSNISINQAALDNKKAENRTVTFTAKIENREKSIDVTGHIYDHVNGDFVFKVLPEFEMAVKNATPENYVKNSGVQAWYAKDLNNIVTIPQTDITLETPIDKTLNVPHPITFKAKYQGNFGTVDSKVTLVDTNIELKAHKHIAITLGDVANIETNIDTKFGTTTSSSEGSVTVTYDQTAIDQIKALDKPNPNGIAVRVTAKSDASSDETYVTTLVHVYDKIEQGSGLAMNVHGAVIELNALNDSKIKTETGVAAWDISKINTDGPSSVFTSLIEVEPTFNGENKTLGDRTVTFQLTIGGTRHIEHTAPVTVLHKYDSGKSEGMNANNFEIALKELSDEAILKKSGAERVIVSTPGSSTKDNKVTVVSPTTGTYPTGPANNVPVVLETENGVQYTVYMKVVNTLIKLNSKDSIVLKHSELNALTESDLLTRLETDAKLDGQGLNPAFKAGDMDRLKALTAGQEAPVVMTIEVSAPNGDATSKDVNVYVSDDFDEGSQIGIIAHDFKAQVNEINRSSFLTKSGVKAVDYSTLATTGKPTPIVDSNISINQDALDNKKAEARQVTFTAKIGNREESTTVTAHIFDKIDGNIVFTVLPEFEMAVNNASEESYVKESGVKAWYAEDLNNQIAIPQADIKLDTPIDKTVNVKHTITFKTEYNGVTGTVDSAVTLVNTNIDLKSNKHVVINLDDAANIEANINALTNATATSSEGNVTITFDQAALDQIKALDKPNANGIQVKVTGKSDTSADETSVMTTVHVFDVVDQGAKLAMNGHGFVVEQNAMTNDKFKTDSEVGAWNLDVLPNNAPSPINRSAINVATAFDADNKTLGDRLVTFEASIDTRHIERVVPVTVVNKYNEAKSEGMNASNFTIALNELSDEAILEKSKAERVVVTAPGTSTNDDKVKVVSPKAIDYPTGPANNVPVVLETEKGVQYTVYMKVVDTRIELTSKDYVVVKQADLSGLTETALLGKFEAYAELDDVEIATKFKDGDLATLKAVQAGQEEPVPMTIETSAPSGDKTSKPVLVYVVDEFDEGSQIAINAHDFKAQVNEIDRNSFLTKSGVKAYDFATLVNGKPTPIVNSNIAINEAALSNTNAEARPVTFTAKIGNREESVTVTGHIYDGINGDFVFKVLPEFELAVKNATPDNYIKHSGIQAWYAADLNNIVSIPTQDISLETPIDTKINVKHNITFKATYNGMSGTVNSKVTLKDTNITLKANKHVAIDLANVGNIKTDIDTFFGVSSTSTEGGTTVSYDDTALDQIINLSTANPDGIPVRVTSKSNSSADETYVTTTVHVFDKLNSGAKLAMNGHGFVIEQGAMTDNKFKNDAEVGVWNIENLPNSGPISINRSQISVAQEFNAANKKLGDREVTFEFALSAMRMIEHDVPVTVVHKYDATKQEGMNAFDFEIAIKELSDEAILEKSQAERVVVTTPGTSTNDKNVTVVSPKAGEYPTGPANNVPVVLETENGVQFIVRMKVVDTQIELTSLNSIVLKQSELQNLAENTLLTRLEAHAELDDVELPTSFKAGDMDALKAIKVGQEAPIKMTIETSAPSGDATSKEVSVFVVDEYDEISQIGMNAHDFKAQVNEVNRATFINRSGVKAYDYSNVELTGAPSPIVESNITINQAALDNKDAVARQVIFTAKVGNREQSVEVTGHIFDGIDGNFVFKVLPEFQVAVKNANEETYIKESGVQAWYAEDLNNQVEIPQTNITLETPIDTTLNKKHSITFKAEHNGEFGTVGSKVTLVDTNIELKANKHVAIKLDDVANIETNIATLFGVTASSSDDSVTVSYDQAALDQIKALTEPNAGGIRVKVTANADNSSDETYVTTTVHVFDQINTSSELAMNGHGFVVELKDLTNNKLKDMAAIGAWDLSTLPNNEPSALVRNQINIDQDNDESNKTLGDRNVSYEVTLNGTRQIIREVPVTVVHKYDSSKSEGINANNFSIAVRELSPERILEKSNAERVVVTEPGDSTNDNKVKVISPVEANYPTEAKANVPVVLETENGVQYTVYMDVVDTNINLQADALVNMTLDQANAINDTSFKSLAHISATQDGFGAPIIEIEQDKLDELRNLEESTSTSIFVKVKAISVDPTEPRDNTEKTVEVRVFDEIGTNYALRVKNIVAKYDDVRTKNQLMKETDVKIINLNTNREIIILPTDVNFIANVDGVNTVIESLELGTNQKVMVAPTGAYGIDAREINANVYDDYDPNTGLSINAVDFIAKLSDVDTSEKVVTEASAMVYDAKTALERPDLEVIASEVPMKLGKHVVTFKHGALTTQSTGDIYNEYNPATKETMNANDFVIQLSEITEASLKKGAEVKAFTVNDDGTTTPLADEKISVVTLPTEIGTKSVTFKTEKGTEYTVTVYVMDKYDPESLISFEGHNFDIELDEVSDTEFERLSEVKAFDVSNVANGAPVEIAVTLETELPTEIGTHDVQYSAKTLNGKATYDLKANVFDKIDPITSESINAHDFAIQLEDITEEQVKIDAGLEAFKLLGEGKTEAIDVADINVSALPTTVGTHPITFTTVAGTEITVDVNVFDEIDPVNMIGFEGHNFDIQLDDVTVEEFAALSEIKAYDISKVASQGKVELTPKLETELPTDVGTYVIQYSAEADTRTATYDVTVNVFNKIDPITNESINAHNFSIQLEDVSINNVRRESGIEAFKLLGEGKTEAIDVQDIAISALPTTVGTHPITFTTAAGTTITVQAYVFDVIDPVNKIGFEGHNFDIQLEDVSKEEFATLSEVKAFDISDNGKVELTPKLETELPTTVGTHDVQYSAKAGDRVATLDLKVNVFNMIDPVTNESINAHDFSILLNDVNEENVKDAAGLEAFKLHGNGDVEAIDVEDIDVSTLPAAVGTHSITFTTAAGTERTVQAYVFDVIDPVNMIGFEGHNFDIQLEDVSKEEFATLSEVKAFDISDNGKVELTPKLETELPTTVGTHDVQYSAKAGDRVATLDLKANVFNKIDPITNESINAHDFAIQLKDVSETRVKTDSGLEAFKLHGNGTTEAIDVADIDVSALPTEVGTHEITFTTAAGTEITVQAHVFDEINPETEIAFEGHSFNIKLEDVSKENFATLSEIKAFDVSDVVNNGKVEIATNQISELPTTVGDHDVAYEATVNGETAVYNVVAHVYKDISPDGKYGIRAEDFTAEVKDVQNEQDIIANAKVKVYELNTYAEVNTAVITSNPNKLGAGINQVVTFKETTLGLETTVVANVYDHIDPETNTALIASDFVAKLGDVQDEAGIIKHAGAKVYNVNTQEIITDAVINTNPNKLERGKNIITISSGKLSTSVVGTAYDNINPETKESMNANDFIIALDKVSEENMLKYSNVEAFDVTNVNNIVPVTGIKVISKLPDTTGNHEVTFATPKGTTISVTVTVTKHGDIKDGEDAIFANDFTVGINDLNNENVKALAGVEAIDLSVTPPTKIDNSKVSVSTLVKKPGNQDVTFRLESGRKVTVTMTVTATYRVEGNNITMKEKDVKAAIANGTLEQEIIKLSNAKAIVVETGEIAGDVSVNYNGNMPTPSTKVGEIVKLSLDYNVDNEFLTQESRGFDIFKAFRSESKETTKISKDITLTVVANDGNSGKDDGKDNGSGGGKLPTTGLTQVYTLSLFGILLLLIGLIFVVLNKRRQNAKH